MELERDSLIAALNVIKPAISQKELIAAFSHVWLDGKTIAASNDVGLGIETPFVSELRGGLKGSVLLGVLENSQVKKIDVESNDDGSALFLLGKTKLNLKVLPEDNSVYSAPSVKGTKAIDVTDEFIDALKFVDTSIKTSSINPDLTCAAFMLQGALQIYGTDSKTLSWATVSSMTKWAYKPGEVRCMPAHFVKEIIRCGGEGSKLYLSDEGMALVTKNSVKVSAQWMQVDEPPNYKAIIENATKDVETFPIPDRLQSALERAIIMMNKQSDEAVSVAIKDGMMRITAETVHGDLKEAIKLDSKVSDVQIRVAPDLVKQGLGDCEEMGFSDSVCIMKNKNCLYIVAGMV